MPWPEFQLMFMAAFLIANQKGSLEMEWAEQMGRKKAYLMGIFSTIPGVHIRITGSGSPRQVPLRG